MVIEKHTISGNPHSVFVLVTMETFYIKMLTIREISQMINGNSN